MKKPWTCKTRERERLRTCRAMASTHTGSVRGRAHAAEVSVTPRAAVGACVFITLVLGGEARLSAPNWHLDVSAVHFQLSIYGAMLSQFGF